MLTSPKEKKGQAKRLFRNAVAGAALLCFMPLSAYAVASAGAEINGVTLLDYFEGTDCSGGGFPDCYASQNGVNIAGDFEASAIYKYNTDGTVDFGYYASIDGAEFDVDYTPDILSWTYNPGVFDPAIHYFTVKQASGFALFYSAAEITAWSADIWDVLGYNDYSHVTWFNSVLMTSSGGPGGGEIPESSTLGLFGAALLGLGLVRRRRGRN